jgi:anti-sigma B factor antagonist
MNWSSSRSGTAFIGHPQGRVDEGSWEGFLGFLNIAIGEAAEAGLPMILDLSGIDYMSSRGLRALTLARKEAEAKGIALTLARPNEMLREILSMSRYDKIFTVSDSLD